MSEATDLIEVATAQEATAQHYADLIRICTNDLPVVHDVCRELRLLGRTWTETDGYLCLRIGDGDVVFDGRTYIERRADAYRELLTRDAVQEALFEYLAEDRPGKLEGLQLIRAQVKSDHPNPGDM
jgi:hypothetical protein